MKTDKTPIICGISSVFLLLFDFFKFDIIVRIKGSGSFGAGIISGFLLIIPYVIYAIIVILSILYLIKKVKLKKWKAFIPVAIMIITVFILGVFPYSYAYLRLYYSLNKVQFSKTIELVNNEEIGLYQIGMNKYIAPYRTTSYSDILYMDKHDDVTEIMFFAFSGFKEDVIIVYSSDNSGINEKDFSDSFPQGLTWNFKNIEKIDDYWYSATVIT